MLSLISRIILSIVKSIIFFFLVDSCNGAPLERNILLENVMKPDLTTDLESVDTLSEANDPIILDIRGDKVSDNLVCRM